MKLAAEPAQRVPLPASAANTEPLQSDWRLLTWKRALWGGTGPPAGADGSVGILQILQPELPKLSINKVTEHPAATSRTSFWVSEEEN